MSNYEIIIGAELSIKSKLSNREIQIRNRIKHPEKHRANFENWRVKNKVKRNEYMRKWNAANPKKLKINNRKSALKRKYNITPKEYEVMLLLQNGHCALCDKTPKQECHGVLHVDHCHDTNRIRGLLCNNCNGALGKLGDNEAGLLNALKYIKGSV